MTQKKISLPEIVSREEWLKERKELLKEEKKFTRQRDKLNANGAACQWWRLKRIMNLKVPMAKLGYLICLKDDASL